MLYRPIRMLADKFNVIQRGLVRAKNIFEVLDDDQLIPTNREKTEHSKYEGDVVFDSVKFAYNEDDYVLKNISFDIKKGQTVAFVGATGAGKRASLIF